MCGIAGVLEWDPGSGPRVDAQALDAALAHRGPDGAGVFADGPVLLVHRRLAIIDPSEGGHQPMTSPDGRFTLAFNGEVYNYQELRGDLVAAGEAFDTASDTEVLLRLLAREGPPALDRVRGMFALALWDGAERRLTLARDRFGIKPLYAAAGRGRVAFASEIGALRRAGLVAREVDPAGVLAYLAWGHVPGPVTWLRGVESLEPGTWVAWDAGGRRCDGRFADVRRVFAPGAPADLPTLRERVAGALRESVAAHLVADVPVGVFLSGGIDSGAVVSAARSVSSGRLQTYTVAGDADRDPEMAAARLVAERFDTEHHEIVLEAPDLAAELPTLLGRLDSPTLDAVNSWFVSRAVARTGIKAVLSGVGGDEVFGGYPSFRTIPHALRAARAGGRLLGLAARVAGGWRSWRARKWAHFASAPSVGSGYRAMRGLFMPEEWPALLGPAFDGDAGAEARARLAAVEQPLSGEAAAGAPVADVARLETTMYLRHQLLRDIDAVSMAHALEVRVPLVDHALLDAVWPALAGHPDLIGGKPLLWQGLARALPDTIVRAPKRGFTLPFDAWMRGALAGDTRDGVRAAVAAGWVRPEAADAVVDDWTAGRAHWSRAWALSMLGRFLEEAP